MPREVELKFELETAAIHKLKQLRWLRKPFSSAKRKELVSVYFDTPKFKLRDKGLSLRVRHIGRKRLQTIKEDRGEPLARREWEVKITSDEPDLSLASGTALESLVCKKLRRKLRPVFETSVQRTTIPLHWDNGRIELAIDRGRIKTAKRFKSISEIELELKGGDVRALVEIAKRLAQDLSVRYGVKSKAERGYELADNQDIEAACSEPITLGRDATVADGLKIIGLSCLRHFARNEEAVRDGNSEGIHQMRVGLRRMRAAHSIFKQILQDPESENLNEDLKWLTEQLGPARDYDVFVKDSVVPLQKAEPDTPELGTLKSALQQRRMAGFARAKRAVESDRYRRIVVMASLWLAGGTWSTSSDELRRICRERPIKAFAAEILSQRTEKLVEKVKKLKSLDARHRHKLRIAVKKLRYATEFFAAPFRGTRSKHKEFVAVLKELQGALGKLNDIKIHDSLSDEIVHSKKTSSRGDVGKETAFAMGLLTGRERSEIKRLMKVAAKSGKQLSKSSRFWN
jgi:triphosphatase